MGTEGIFPTIFGSCGLSGRTRRSAVFHDWDGFGRLFERKTVDQIEDSEGPVKAVEHAVVYIKKERPQLTFIHLDHVDDAGHNHGHGTPEYYAAVAEADRLIGLVLRGLEDAGIADRTVVLVTSDHGGVGKKHGGNTMAEIEIPWIITARAWPPARSSPRRSTRMTRPRRWPTSSGLRPPVLDRQPGVRGLLQSSLTCSNVRLSLDIEKEILVIAATRATGPGFTAIGRSMNKFPSLLAVCIALLLELLVWEPRAGAKETEPAAPDDPIVVHLIHPDRQAATIRADLSKDVPLPTPSGRTGGLEAAPCADPDQLGKPLEAVIAFFNPEMVREWSAFHDTRLLLGFDPATGSGRWRLAVPGDDGSLAALITALRLSGSEETLAPQWFHCRRSTGRPRLSGCVSRSGRDRAGKLASRTRSGVASGSPGFIRPIAGDATPKDDGAVHACEC